MSEKFILLKFIILNILNASVTASLFPAGACFLLNRACGNICPTTYCCGIPFLNLAALQAGAIQQTAIPLPGIPSAVTAPSNPFATALPLPASPFRPLCAPPILATLQTAPIVPPPRILQPPVPNPPQVQLIPLSICAMPSRKVLQAPITNNDSCTGDCCIDCCCPDDCMCRRRRKVKK